MLHQGYELLEGVTVPFTGIFCVPWVKIQPYYFSGFSHSFESIPSPLSSFHFLTRLPCGNSYSFQSFPHQPPVLLTLLCTLTPAHLGSWLVNFVGPLPVTNGFWLGEDPKIIMPTLFPPPSGYGGKWDHVSWAINLFQSQSPLRMILSKKKCTDSLDLAYHSEESLLNFRTPSTDPLDIPQTPGYKCLLHMKMHYKWERLTLAEAVISIISWELDQCKLKSLSPLFLPSEYYS